MRASIFAASLLAICAQAIQITAPTKNQVVDLAAGYEVKWTTVASDPASAHLFLVRMTGGNEPFSKDLGEIDLTAGKFKVTDADVPEGKGFQFNIQANEVHNTGILAQSQQFEVKESGKKSSSSSTITTVTTKATGTGTAAATESTAASESAASESAASSVVPSASGSSTVSATSSATSPAVSTGAAVANKAVQSGSLLALVMGLVAMAA